MQKFVFAIACGLAIPIAAEAQVCRGGIADPGETVRVGARVDHLDQATRVGGSVGYGVRRWFGQAELGTVTFRRVDETAVRFESDLTYAAFTTSNRRLELCPTLAFGSQVGPASAYADPNASSSIDWDRRHGALGLSVGFVAFSRAGIQVVPYGSAMLMEEREEWRSRGYQLDADVLTPYDYRGHRTLRHEVVTLGAGVSVGRLVVNPFVTQRLYSDELEKVAGVRVLMRLTS